MEEHCAADTLQCSDRNADLNEKRKTIQTQAGNLGDNGQKRQVWTTSEQQKFFTKIVELEHYDNLRELFQHMERV